MSPPPPSPSPRALPAVIPVLDLMAGEVVRGVGGQRSAYRPIVSSLGPGSEPVSLAAKLLAQGARLDTASAASAAADATAVAGHDRVARLYVADLDAITTGVPQVPVLAALLRGLPALHTLWLDAGFADVSAALSLLAALREAGCSTAQVARVQPVFGSESVRSLAALQQALAAFAQAPLSLDARGAQRLDPAGCWARPGLWPLQVIAMSLHRVGSGAGPDLAAFAALRGLRPDVQWFGAGGLRDRADLQAAAAQGAAGWLVSSALHEGTLAP